jgi:hypothetical protein
LILHFVARFLLSLSSSLFVQSSSYVPLKHRSFTGAQSCYGTTQPNANAASFDTADHNGANTAADHGNSNAAANAASDPDSDARAHAAAEYVSNHTTNRLADACASPRPNADAGAVAYDASTLAISIDARDVHLGRLD